MNKTEKKNFKTLDKLKDKEERVYDKRSRINGKCKKLKRESWLIQRENQRNRSRDSLTHIENYKNRGSLSMNESELIKLGLKAKQHKIYIDNNNEKISKKSKGYNFPQLINAQKPISSKKLTNFIGEFDPIPNPLPANNNRIRSILDRKQSLLANMKDLIHPILAGIVIDELSKILRVT